MKKILCLLLAVLTLSGGALAEEAEVSTANGVVESVNIYDITAPCSGVLKPFDWKSGDAVQAGDTLFEMETLKVYAPADGVLQAAFAQAGDLCEDVIAQYGAIASMERMNPYIIQATTSEAYDDDENRVLHVGEKLYFERVNNDDITGEGRVISVRASGYVVEVLTGSLKAGNGVKLYRSPDRKNKSRVGSGRAERAENLSIMGSGRVVTAYYVRGSIIRKGDLLFELLSADGDAALNSARIKAEQNGAVVIKAVSGQQVYKGQVLAEIHDLSMPRVNADVDEIDLNLIEVGSTVTVVFDRYMETRVTGRVESISRVGVQKLNATYYSVRISFTSGLEILPGMNATVWLNSAS